MHDTYTLIDLVHGRVRIVVCDLDDTAIKSHGDKTISVGRPRNIPHLHERVRAKRRHIGTYFIITLYIVHLCLPGIIGYAADADRLVFAACRTQSAVKRNRTRAHLKTRAASGQQNTATPTYPFIVHFHSRRLF